MQFWKYVTWQFNRVNTALYVEACIWIFTIPYAIRSVRSSLLTFCPFKFDASFRHDRSASSRVCGLLMTINGSKTNALWWKGKLFYSSLHHHFVLILSFVLSGFVYQCFYLSLSLFQPRKGLMASIMTPGD